MFEQHTLDMVVHTYKLSNWVVEAGSEVQGHSQLLSKLDPSLGYMRPCQKERGREREKGRKKKKESCLVT